MIITIDISQIVYNTGVSRYTKELVRYLLKIDKTSHYKLFAGVWRQRKEIDKFLASLDKYRHKFTPYIKIFPPKMSDMIWNRWHLHSIEKFVGDTDIVHTSNWAQPPAKAKLITTVHDLTPILFPEYHTSVIVSNFKRNLELIRKYHSLVFCDSQATADDLSKYWGNKLQPQLKVVYLGVDKQFNNQSSKQDIQNVMDKYGISNKYILSVGTLEPRKNLHRTIQAFIQAKLFDYKLVIVGKKGWGQQLSNDLNVKMLDVIFTGFVDENDLPLLYSGAKMFVYPSLYEGFGLPVLEAMQSGTAVITSANSSLLEVGGQAVVYVDPLSVDDIAEQMRKLADNIALRKSFVKKGLMQSKKFSWNEMARRVLKEYKSSI